MPVPGLVQVIQRKDSTPWYINFPAAIAQAMEFAKGETVEWVIQDKRTLQLRRLGDIDLAGKRKIGLWAI